jgi:hypothetical protein
VTLTRETEGYYDPVTMTYVPGETETFTGKGSLDSFEATTEYGMAWSDGDVRVIILAEALGTDPTVGDTLTIQGRTLAVLGAVLDPAGASWIVRAS